MPQPRRYSQEDLLRCESLSMPRQKKLSNSYKGSAFTAWTARARDCMHSEQVSVRSHAMTVRSAYAEDTPWNSRACAEQVLPRRGRPRGDGRAYGGCMRGGSPDGCTSIRVESARRDCSHSLLRSPSSSKLRSRSSSVRRAGLQQGAPRSCNYDELREAAGYSHSSKPQRRSPTPFGESSRRSNVASSSAGGSASSSAGGSRHSLGGTHRKRGVPAAEKTRVSAAARASAYRLRPSTLKGVAASNPARGGEDAHFICSCTARTRHAWSSRRPGTRRRSATLTEASLEAHEKALESSQICSAGKSTGSGGAERRHLRAAERVAATEPRHHEHAERSSRPEHAPHADQAESSTPAGQRAVSRRARRAICTADLEQRVAALMCEQGTWEELEESLSTGSFNQNAQVSSNWWQASSQEAAWQEAAASCSRTEQKDRWEALGLERQRLAVTLNSSSGPLAGSPASNGSQAASAASKGLQSQRAARAITSRNDAGQRSLSRRAPVQADEMVANSRSAHAPHGKRPLWRCQSEAPHCPAEVEEESSRKSLAKTGSDVAARRPHRTPTWLVALRQEAAHNCKDGEGNVKSPVEVEDVLPCNRQEPDSEGFVEVCRRSTRKVGTSAATRRSKRGPSWLVALQQDEVHNEDREEKAQKPSKATPSAEPMVPVQITDTNDQWSDASWETPSQTPEQVDKVEVLDPVEKLATGPEGSPLARCAAASCTPALAREDTPVSENDSKAMEEVCSDWEERCSQLSASDKKNYKPPAISEEELAAAICDVHEQQPQVEDYRKISGTERDMLEMQVSKLSNECFQEDSMEVYTQSTDWNLVFYHQGARLLGYLVYRRWPPPLRMVVVLRLAVVPEQRCKGHGGRLLEWMDKFAQQLPSTDCNKIGLRSLPGAVDFYRKLGFVESSNVAGALDDDHRQMCQEEQTWMEKKVKRARAASRPRR
mmetsp:Transcript_1090/g.2013  ORF Transcript_1090/g.2013 Transcript_1090/m.2013 type:complete len:943 (+) Transcript_1090:81-2909(+)